MLFLAWAAIKISGCTDEDASAPPRESLAITNLGGESCPPGYLVAWILHQHSDGPLPFTCVPPPYPFGAHGERLGVDSGPRFMQAGSAGSAPTLIPNIMDPVPGFASAPHVRPLFSYTLSDQAARDIGIAGSDDPVDDPIVKAVLEPGSADVHDPTLGPNQADYGIGAHEPANISVISNGAEKARFTPQTATYNQDLVVHGNLVVHGKLTVDGKITQGERTTP